MTLLPTEGVLASVRFRSKSAGMLIGYGLLATSMVALALCGSPHILDIAIITMLYVCMALGLNLVVGYCQLFDLGYAGFVCLGAYTTAILVTKFHCAYLPAAACSVLISLTAGIVLGLPTLRLRGDYFAIVTFGFAEVVVLLMRNWTGVTGGPFGFGGIPDPILLGIRLHRYPPVDYYMLLLLITALLLIGLRHLRRTMLGGQMIAVGSDETLCALSGIDVVSVKLSAFAFSAGIGGLIGSFWAAYYQFLSYEEFTFTLSVQVISIVILAGGLTLRGIVIAGTLIAPASEILRTWLRSTGLPEASRIILVGVILIALTLGRSKNSATKTHQLCRLLHIRRRPGGLNVVADRGSATTSTERPETNMPFRQSSGTTVHLSEGAPLLCIEKLSVSFGGTKALIDVDLKVRAGQVIAVVGPNGCGKTSLLNGISGLVASTGKVLLKGRDLSREPAWIRARQGIARTLQTPREFSRLEHSEQVRLSEWASRRSPARSTVARLTGVLLSGSVPLKGRKDETRVQYGSLDEAHGTQLRRAFSKKGTLVLLDEPLAGLSSDGQLSVLQRIGRHKRSGGAVIVVEHNVSAVLDICDAVLEINQGRVVFSGSSEDYGSRRKL